MMVAVLGHVNQADRTFLAGCAATGASAYALVLDVNGWDRDGRQAGPPRGARDRRGCAAAAGRRPPSARDGSLAAAWQELAR